MGKNRQSPLSENIPPSVQKLERGFNDKVEV